MSLKTVSNDSVHGHFRDPLNRNRHVSKGCFGETTLFFVEAGGILCLALDQVTINNTALIVDLSLERKQLLHGLYPPI